MGNWTPEEDERLQQLLGQYSVRQIGSMMGRSHNSIVGRSHRMGWALGAPKKRKAAPKPRPKMTAAPADARNRPFFNFSAKNRLGGLRARISPSVPMPAPVVDPRPARLLSLFDLACDSCRWPYGDPQDAGFGFCGTMAVANKPYCAFHLALSYDRGLFARARSDITIERIFPHAGRPVPDHPTEPAPGAVPNAPPTVPVRATIDD